MPADAFVGQTSVASRLGSVDAFMRLPTELLAGVDLDPGFSRLSADAFVGELLAPAGLGSDITPCMPLSTELLAAGCLDLVFDGRESPRLPPDAFVGQTIASLRLGSVDVFVRLADELMAGVELDPGFSVRESSRLPADAFVAAASRLGSLDAFMRFPTELLLGADFDHAFRARESSRPPADAFGPAGAPGLASEDSLATAGPGLLLML